eukprot:TRINITY_DN3148_c0_g1_i1.p1 TRINITY_DN3148_c0_g1~~TRINITY_DN3148_c0_g1_i1.p1  ORF type:complete len:305 (-),score=77.36 TRINITY_DN3148_c0_g1_i1:477-1364(-)
MACCQQPGKITEAVRDRYGRVAREEMTEERSRATKEIASSFGYSEEELSLIPEGANMGLSCGNPTALAHLKPGETVVDLGSGGGMDCFIASSKVGAEGKVIGIDMTADMINLAKSNAIKRNITNTEFRLGRIEALPLDDELADVVISNCVINLVPDKKRAFAEIYRVLKPGGRLAVSDIALKKDLPAEIKQSVAALVGCIAGAQLVDHMERDLKEAGFSKVMIVDSQVDLNVYAKLALDGEGSCCGTSCCPPAPSSSSSSSEPSSSASFGSTLIEIAKKFNINEYAMSVKVYALK